MKNKLFIISRLCVTLILIYGAWFFLKDNSAELLQALASADKPLLMWGFALFAFNVVILAFRLKYVLKTQHLVLSLRESVIINFIGFFFNSFLPTAVGGDVVRGYYVSEKFKKKRLEIYAAIIADRTMGLISIACIAIVAIFFVQPGLVGLNVRLSTVIIFFSSVIFIVFSLNQRLASRFGILIKIIKFFRIEEAARRVYKVLNDFRHFKRETICAFLMAFAGQLLIITVAFVIAQSLGMNLPYEIFLFFMPIISAVSLMPSLGGTGPREGAFILLFGQVASEAHAGGLALIWLTYVVALSLLGGIVYLASGYHKLTFSEIKEIEVDYDKQKTA